MSYQVPSASADNPIVLRASAGAAWVWVVLAAFFAFALVRGYLGAATTAGHIGVVIFVGSCIGLFVWAAAYMLMHRSTISISASQIIYARATTRRADRQILVLDRSSGDLGVLTARRGNRTYVTGLTIHGSGTTLPVRTFDPNLVRKACRSKGWQFPV